MVLNIINRGGEKLVDRESLASLGLDLVFSESVLEILSEKTTPEGLDSRHKIFELLNDDKNRDRFRKYVEQLFAFNKQITVLHSCEFDSQIAFVFCR